MKNVLRLCLAVAVIGFVPAAQAAAPEQAFLQNIRDVPLMAGLQELPGEGHLFDKPEGRIAEAVAVVERGERTEINSFYERTLPQLGWASAGPGRFIREGQRLEIRVEEAVAGLVVRFILDPHP